MVKSFFQNSSSRFVLITALMLSCLTGHTQLIDLSLQTKFYPAGSIYGLRAERKVDSKNSLSLMVAYNILYHRDLGVHQDERGGGPGISLSYRHYWKENHQGLFLGAMMDLYLNHVRFKDNINTSQLTQGKHDVLVVQPLAEIGYLFLTKNEKFRFGPYLSFGWEINSNYSNVSSTNPADIANPASGEGSMLIIGFTVGKALGR